MSVPESIAQPHAAAAAPLVVDYYLHGDTLIIASASIPGRLYVTTANDCSCPAGLQDLPCKHAELRLSLLRPQTDAPIVLTLDQADQLAVQHGESPPTRSFSGADDAACRTACHQEH